MYPPPSYYDTPNEGDSAPVWPWYCAYVASMALLYVFVTGYGVFLLAMAAGAFGSGFGRIPPGEEVIIIVYGVLMLVVGGVFLVAYGVAPFLPKKPWSWIYHMILICIGFTSACCMPFSGILMFYWLKPETKRMFGRK